VTKPTITFYHGHLNDCITTTDFTKSDDGNTSTFTCVGEDIFKLAVSVSGGNEETKVVNDNNIGVDATIFSEIKIRYKTSDNNIKAKVILEFDDATKETVLDDSSSTSWTTVTETISASKTVDHIYLYADHAVGTVYYDFALIYRGTFTFPYVSRGGESGGVGFHGHNIYPKQQYASRQGNVTQWMGADSPIFELTGDMDDRTEWKGGATLGTYVGEALLRIFVNAKTEAWQWFECSEPNFKGKVVMEDLDLEAVSGSGKKRLYNVVLRKYDQSSGTIDVWSDLDWLGL